MAQKADGIAEKTRNTFHMSCSVAIRIAASRDRVWRLLTDAAGYTEWNSTLKSLEGDIAPGGTVKMTVPQVPRRTFKVKVTEFEANRRMVWRDGFAPIFQGVRTFSLESGDGGEPTFFTMREEFSGLFLPMIAGQLPDFKPIFQRYAADLKSAAECD
jgi:uncharacterized protein YndB with AHSA1/START domain